MKRSLTALLALGAIAAVALVVAPLSATPLPARSTAPTVDVSLDDDEDAPACHRTEFDTEMVKKACAEGGQFAAKRAMKHFVRAAKKTLSVGNVDCKTCHTGLAPEYALKDDGLTRFNDWKKQLEAAEK